MGLVDESVQPLSDEEPVLSSPPGKRHMSSTANLEGLFTINSTPIQERLNTTEKLIS